MVDISKANAMMFLSETPVHFLGFTSNLAQLYSKGWELQAEFDVYHYAQRFCLTHRHLGLAGFVEHMDLMQSHRIPLYIQQVVQAKHTTIRMHTSVAAEFVALEPALLIDNTITRGCRDFPLCSLLGMEDPKELIVEPEKVQDLLEKIIGLQRPAQAELRDKNRKSVKRTAAKIITLSDYQAA